MPAEKRGNLLQLLLIQRLVHVPDFTPPADGPDPCELAHNPRYRKGPAVCFDSTENVSLFSSDLDSSWLRTILTAQF